MQRLPDVNFLRSRAHASKLFPLRATALTLFVGYVVISIKMYVGSCSNTILETSRLRRAVPGVLPLSTSELDLLEKKTGIYMDEKKSQQLANVVLLTAGNFGYLTLYQNWACYAKSLGLKWLVLAADIQMYETLGPNIAILSDTASNQTSESTLFWEPKFNKLVCNKMHDVRRILLYGGVDVVFSDCDNVFRQDPFAFGVSLGDLIRTRRYDYVFQHNSPIQEAWIHEPNEGNTGFYFVSGTKNLAKITALFTASLTECKEHEELDDQSNFWSVFRRLRDGDVYRRWSASGTVDRTMNDEPFRGARFCDSEANDVEGGDILAYCSMNAYQHPAGAHKNISDLVTFHANFITGHDKKMARLRELNLWHEGSCD